MSNWANKRQLTWDPVFPLPFESIWSIFAKVVALNNLSLRELVRLIKKRDVVVLPTHPADSAGTEWIDFDEFSSLLNVEPERLMLGTWSGLGMTPRYRDRYGVRQCPKCWECGYHCILFDLNVVEACPWHKCRLTMSCPNCVSPDTFSLHSKIQPLSTRTCSRCGLELHGRRKITEIGLVKWVNPESIRACCVSLVNWWRAVADGFADRDGLLAELLWVGGSVQQRVSNLDLQFGQAVQVAGEPDKAWQLTVTPIHVTYAKLEANWRPRGFGEPRSMERGQLIRDPAGKAYRSLRSYIYKTYVRRHCRCYSELRNLQRDESLRLDGHKVCCVSLAFLIWRMSIEGLVQIDGIRYHRRDNFPLRFMSPRRFYRLPVEASLRWSYFAFFGIWRRLEAETDVVEGKLRVVTSGDVCEGYFHWVCTDEMRDGFSFETEPVTKQFAMIYPSISAIIETSLVSCHERHSRRAGLVHPCAPAAATEWSGIREDNNIRNCLFQIDFPCGDGGRNGMRYLEV